MNSEFYNHKKVSEIVEDYCKENQIDEYDFATLIDVHPTSLSRIKAGKMASHEALFKIAALGKVEINEIFQSIPARVKSEIRLSGQINNLPAVI